MGGKIFIIGGTGTTGKVLVRLLHEAGENILVLARSEDKAKPLQAKGVATVIGDLGSHAIIEEALTDVEKVFLLTAVFPGQVDLQNNFIDQAKKAGIKHLVKFSAIGARHDSPINLAKWHAASEEHLKKSGIPYTIIQPHSFMQNLLGSLDTIRSQGAIYQCMEDAKFPMIDIRDIATFAFKVLTEQGHEGKTYILTGPEAISMHEAADAIGVAIGKTVRYIPIGYDEMKKNLQGIGMPEWFANDLVELSRMFAMGIGQEVTNDYAKVVGTPQTTIQQFARDYASIFSGK